MRKWISTLTALAVLSMGALWGPSVAADPAGATAPIRQPLAAELDEHGRAFLMKAAQGNMAEVQLGTLAAERAMSDRVKQFAQRMVADHSKAQQELMDLAKQQNWALPTEVSDEQKKTHERLAKLSGEEFDREYMAHMVKDHEEDVAMYERGAAELQDAALKAYATRTLPVLREHLQQAREISGIKEQEAEPAE